MKRNYGISSIPDSADIIDSGYAENKEIFMRIKQAWAVDEPDAVVTRVRSDTRGLISYIVWKNNR